MNDDGVRSEKDFRSLCRQDLDPEMISNLDKDGDGVDKVEFVVGMLVSMGSVNEREVGH